MSRQAKNTFSVEFGNRLRSERKARGLTQGEFAELGGIVLNSQSRYESGLTEPNASYLARLAEAEIDVIYLLTGRRSSAVIDDPEVAELVTLFVGLPETFRLGALAWVRTVTDSIQAASAPGDATMRPQLHDRRPGFRSESD